MSLYRNDDEDNVRDSRGRYTVGFRPTNTSRATANFEAFRTEFEDDDAPRATVASQYGNRLDRLTVRSTVANETKKNEDRRRATKMRESKTGRATSGAVFVDDVEEVTLDGKDVFKTYDYTKPANTVLRWNLLWLFLLVLGPFPLWATWINCKVTQEAAIIINLIVTLNFIFTTVLCWRYMWKMIRSFNTPYWQELDPDLRERVQHIVVMPTYKEPVELLLETMASVANQTVASSIIFVVGMEEKTPNQEEKKRIMREKYGTSFKALVFAVHPTGVPGEIPGACSNRNYAARAAVKYMIMKGLLPVDPYTKEVELDFTTCTVCDADTTFYYRFFENLTWCFLNENPETRYKVCWQSPLFYNITLDERWFFTRVMGILRSYFMVGFLIGGDINTMSIYTMSLRLLVEGQFFHPGYQMDDIIYTLSAMRATGGRIRIRTVDIPTLSGPTSGVDLIDELKEWIVQAERWTIGAAEVFHYFFVKLLKGNYFLAGLEYFWWFVYYYGFILCAGGLMAMTGFIMFFVSLGVKEVDVYTCKPTSDWFNLSDDFPYWIYIWGFWIFNYGIVYTTAFFMDRLLVQILALDENVGIIRNFVHFLSSQFVIWMYCLVEVKAIIKIAIYGKKVCGHKASEKHALAGKKEGDKLEEPLLK